MLSQTVVDQIACLLAEGQLSQRKIAARLGVSRGTVGLIARGQRGLHGMGDDPGHEDGAHGHGHASPARCPECGARVFLPCVACRARDYRRRQRTGEGREFRLQIVAAGAHDRSAEVRVA